MSLASRILAVGLVVTLIGPGRAAEIDRYLPADTEAYTVVNVEQILKSALVQKVGVDNLRKALDRNEEVKAILDDLGFDPLKHVKKIISTGPSSGEKDKGLTIVHGEFDIEKFRTRARKESKDVIKPFKLLGQECYEVVINDADLSVFVGFASEKVMLAAMSKDYLGDALKVKPTDKAVLKNKAFQEMLEKLDDRQSLAGVVNGDVLTKGPLAASPAGDLLASMTTLSGGLTLTDGIKIQFTAGTKTAEDAKKVQEQLDTYINLGTFAVGGLAMNNERLKPLVNFMKSIRTDVSGKTVTVNAAITAEELNKLMPNKDQ